MLKWEVLSLLSHSATPILTPSIPFRTYYSYFTLPVIFNNDPAEQSRVSELEMLVLYDTNSIAWGLLEKLIVVQLIKKFPVLMEPDS
jgi:hypothetical protein